MAAPHAGDEYRYVLRTALTDDIIGNVPLTGVSFSKSMNGYGSLSADLPIDQDSDYDEYFDRITYTRPSRYVICVERWVGATVTLVWAGIIWSRTIDWGARVIRLQANEFTSYLDRSHVVADRAWNGASAGTFLADILSLAQANPSSDLNINLASTAFIGIDPVTLAVLASSQTTYLGLIDQVASAAPGFEYRMQVSYLGQQVYKTFEYGLPVGRAIGSTPKIVIDATEPGQGGNVLAYTQDEPGVPTTVIGVASGNEYSAAVWTTTLFLPDDDLLYTTSIETFDGLTDATTVQKRTDAAFDAYYPGFTNKGLILFEVDITESRGVSYSSATGLPDQPMIEAPNTTNRYYAVPDVGDQVWFVNNRFGPFGGGPFAENAKVHEKKWVIGDDGIAKVTVVLGFFD